MLVRENSKLLLVLSQSLSCELMTSASLSCPVKLRVVNQSSTQQLRYSLKLWTPDQHYTILSLCFGENGLLRDHYELGLDHHVIKLLFQGIRSGFITSEQCDEKQMSLIPDRNECSEESSMPWWVFLDVNKSAGYTVTGCDVPPLSQGHCWTPLFFKFQEWRGSRWWWISLPYPDKCSGNRTGPPDIEWQEVMFPVCQKQNCRICFPSSFKNTKALNNEG